MELSAQGLSVELGGRRVLNGVSCRFGTGWTAVVGPNGAGKSTLLRALAGLVRPVAGAVLLDAKPLPVAARRPGRPPLAWLDQRGKISGDLTVHETVALGRLAQLGLFATAQALDAQAVEAAMRVTGCLDQAHTPLSALSGGERQRALLARALATQAPVLLLDEPTTHLDPPYQVAITRLLKQLGRERTVVSVMHDLTLALHADRILLLNEGSVAASGPSADPHLHTQIVAAFDHALRIQSVDGNWLAVPAI